MPPPVRYPAERILNVALALTRAKGLEAVTARNLAAELGCSTGPIFSQFESMDALLEGLMDRIIAAFVQATSVDGPGDPLLVAGEGWLRFAAEEPRLYEALFLRPGPWHTHRWYTKWKPVKEMVAARMAEQPCYAQLDGATRFALVGRAAIVLHGLGLEIWSGRLPPPADPRQLVEQLARPVIQAAIDNRWRDDLHAPTAGKKRTGRRRSQGPSQRNRVTPQQVTPQRVTPPNKRERIAR